MRILGIDPGLQRTGYGLIDVTATGRATIVEAGVIRADARKPLENRVREIYDGLSSVFGDFHPDVAVVEELFSTYGHPKTAILMGHARGVSLLACSRAGCRVFEYTPQQVKLAVVGYGKFGFGLFSFGYSLIFD